MSKIAEGDRVIYLTTGRPATVLRADGPEPWNAGEVKIMEDGAWVSVDTREIFLSKIDN